MEILQSYTKSSMYSSTWSLVSTNRLLTALMKIWIWKIRNICVNLGEFFQCLFAIEYTTYKQISENEDTQIQSTAGNESIIWAIRGKNTPQPTHDTKIASLLRRNVVSA